MKRLVKSAVSAAYARAGFQERSARRLRVGGWLQAPILMYHRVAPDAVGDAVVPLDAFEAQMRELAARRPVPLASIVEPLIAGAPPRDSPPVAVSFDDAYADFWEHAWPVLRKHRIPATLFVLSGFVGRTLTLRERDAARLLDHRFVGPEELKEMSAEGLEVGSHTRTHPILSQLSPERQREEIAGSRLDLERLTERPVRWFAYPNGQLTDFTPATESVVAEAGYTAGLSTVWSSWNASATRWALRRVRIDGTDDVHAFRRKLRGEYDWIGALHQRKQAV